MPVHEPNNATPELTSPSEAALVENLEIVARRLDHIGPELENYTGTDTYPDWWYQDNVSTREILDELRAEDTDPAHLSEYFKLAKREHDIKMAISGYGIDPFNMLYTELGVEVEAAKNEQETLDVSVSLVQEGNLYIIEGKCVTDRLDGNIDQLFELVLGQIKEMKLRMIEDMSFSESVSLEYQFMSDVLFRVYARK